MVSLLQKSNSKWRIIRSSFCLFFYVSIDCAYSHATQPVRISPVVVTGSGDGVCPPSDLIKGQLNITKQQVKQAVASMVDSTLIQNCGGSGWRRVAYRNMSDPSATCPSN